ncbi:MAG: hypothetical protein U0800_01485 [Isosphaeraceae bacterium]
MDQKPAHEASILDKIAAWIPGYGGYLGRADRRAADKLLRDAVADRLRAARGGLDAVIKEAVDRGALEEIGVLERSRQRLDRLADRIRSAGSGTDAFWQGPIDEPKANTLQSFDLALYERADQLAAIAAAPGPGLEAELDSLERDIDRRARLLQGLN